MDNIEKNSKKLFSIKEEKVYEEIIKPVKEIKQKTLTELSPFDLLKLLFVASDKEWDSIPQSQKSKNFFICNRILSRGYPVQAQLINYNGITTDLAIDFWRMKLKNRTLPKWIYAKSTSEKQEVVKKLKVSDDTLINISKFYKCSLSDLQYFSEIYPEDFKDEVKKFEILQKK